MDRKLIPNDVMLTEVSRMLDEGHSVIILTKGNSMLPFIIGDRDSVRLRKKEIYAPGDIVLARIAPGRWVLHRLKSTEDGVSILKGDGNLVGTETCRTSDITGYAEAILKPSGREIDCNSRGFARRSGLWHRLPYFFRRLVLAIFRRII